MYDELPFEEMQKEIFIQTMLVHQVLLDNQSIQDSIVCQLESMKKPNVNEPQEIIQAYNDSVIEYVFELKQLEKTSNVVLSKYFQLLEDYRQYPQMEDYQHNLDEYILFFKNLHETK